MRWGRFLCCTMLSVLGFAATSIVSAQDKSTQKPTSAEANSAPDPAKLQAETFPHAIEGLWVSSLSYQGRSLHNSITITKDPVGRYSGNWFVFAPQKQISNMGVISFTENAVRFEVPSINLVFAGEISADGAQIKGKAKSNGQSADIVFSRLSKIHMPELDGKWYGTVPTDSGSSPVKLYIAKLGGNPIFYSQNMFVDRLETYWSVDDLQWHNDRITFLVGDTGLWWEGTLNSTGSTLTGVYHSRSGKVSSSFQRTVVTLPKPIVGTYRQVGGGQNSKAILDVTFKNNGAAGYLGTYRYQGDSITERKLTEVSVIGATVQFSFDGIDARWIGKPGENWNELNGVITIAGQAYPCSFERVTAGNTSQR